MLVDSILIFAKFFMTIEYPLIQRPKRCLFAPARSCQASLSILRQWRCCTNRNLKCKCGSIWFQARFFFSLPLFQNRSVSNDIVNKALQIAGILSGGYNWQIVMFISIQHAIPSANSLLPFRVKIISLILYFRSCFWTSESSLLRQLFRPLHLCVSLLLKRKVFTSSFFICAFPLELESKTGRTFKAKNRNIKKKQNVFQRIH